MGRPKFTPKTVPSTSTITTPSNTPTHHPKRHLDPVSHFGTVHFPTDIQTHTHRLTDGLGDRSVKWALTLAVLIQSDVLIILLEHQCTIFYCRWAIACSGVYVDRAYNARRMHCMQATASWQPASYCSAWPSCVFLNCYIRVHFASTPISILNLSIS